MERNRPRSLELDQYNEDDIKVLIDRSFDNLVSHSGFFRVRSELSKLFVENAHDKHSAAISQLKSDIESLKKECKAIRLEVKRSQVSKLVLRNNLERLDCILYHRKLTIRNITITDKKQPQIDVENLFKNKLNLGDINIVNCTIMSKHKTCNRNSNAENVIVEFLTPEDCNLVCRQVEKLKNTGIFIEPESSPLLRKRKNKLMILRKELLSRKSNLNISVRNSTLLINGKRFYWDDDKGLCYDFTTPEAAEISGVKYLENFTGLDLREIIHVLRNYDVNT